MQRFLPPICLLLALLMAISGFALLSVDALSPTVDFHRALSSGDEDYAEVLEANMRRRRFARKVLLGCLFGGSVVMTTAAFFTMRPSEG
jgi:hypothetical protein